MSVLYDSDSCVFVSHQQFINNVYKESVYNTSYIMKDELFEINCPFKKVSLKRKSSELDKSYEDLWNDAQYIDREFKKFVLDLKNAGILNSDNEGDSSNSKAIGLSEETYNNSGVELATNLNGKNENSLMITLNKANYLFPSNCEFYSKDVSQLGSLLTGCKYDVIVIDPPWLNKAVRRKKLKNNNGYQMMSNDHLADIPIQSLLSDEGILIVWCTNSLSHMKALTEDIFEKWNVKLAAKWFWLKVTKSGEPIINFTEPPAKLPFEQIIIATKATYTNELLTKSNRKIIVSIPSAIHSHKPPLEEVVRPYMKGKDGKKLEVFARYLLPGWTSFGWEVLRLQHECLYNCS